MTIFDLPKIVAHVLPSAITPSSIQEVFRVSDLLDFEYFQLFTFL